MKKIEKIEGLKFNLLTEKEAKIKISKDNLDYTYLNSLFVKQIIDNYTYYVELPNYQFCIKIINDKKKAESLLGRTSW